jgi:type II secretory pathway component PulJ
MVCGFNARTQLNQVSYAYTEFRRETLRGGTAPCAPADGRKRRRSPLSRFISAACVALLILVCAEGISAYPLGVYHDRVRRAIVLLSSSGAAVDGEESDRQRERAEEARVIGEVRTLLPPNDTVEWQGEVLRVDNNWLKEALDAYEAMPPADPKRAEAISRMADRLQALDDRLNEIEAPAGKPIDKDGEKARLAAILRRDEYNRQAAEGNALTRIVRRIRDWINGLFPKRERSDNRRDSRAVNTIGQVVISLACLAVILYAAWRFLPRFLRRERRKRKPKERGARVVLGERLGADESSADLLAEAETLARSGDLRAAIRKGYIALLCELHDRKLVRIEQHKTNRDYLRAVQSNPSLYDEMKPMTASFENHWYGFIPATETDWQTFRARYRKAVTSDR